MTTTTIICIAAAFGTIFGWAIAEFAEDLVIKKLRKQLAAKDDELVLAHELIDELQAGNNSLCLGVPKVDGQLLIHWH